jgi:hypothetical protein
VALALYRRHRRDCKAGHPEQLHGSKHDERKKGWKRCACPITASGTLAERFRRQSTARWEWDAAEEVLDDLEKAGSWASAAPAIASATKSSLSSPASDRETPRITILEATEDYLAK